ncbi:MAG TPA: hypothetical protein VGP68_18825 [Gemmataceae bacterium]|jgi:hypothetical protein|nr:hypothetical protein [Gemmataceae bacterium]
MRHLLLTAAIIVVGVAGCASTDDANGPDPWAAFKKDLRGDNMQMRSNFGTSNDTEPQAGSLKPSWF